MMKIVNEANLLNYIGGGLLMCVCFKADGSKLVVSVNDGDISEDEKNSVCEFTCDPYGFATFFTLADLSLTAIPSYKTSNKA